MTYLHLIRRCQLVAPSGFAQFLETVSGTQGRVHEELDAFQFPEARILIDDDFKLDLLCIFAGLPEDVVAISVIEEHAQPNKANTTLLPRHWIVTEHNPMRQRPQRASGDRTKKLLEATGATHLGFFEGRRAPTVFDPDDRIAWKQPNGSYLITDLDDNEICVVPAST